MKNLVLFLAAAAGMAAHAGNFKVSDPSTVCETERGAPTQAKLIFRYDPTAGIEVASAMELDGQSVLRDPKAVFNHMGLVFFHADGGLEFRLSFPDGNSFVVTKESPRGGDIILASGRCEN